jgi:uncharacterized membrane protein
MEPAPVTIVNEKTFFKYEPRAKERHPCRHAITIGRTPADVYSFLLSLDHLIRVIKGVDDIQRVGEEDSRWMSSLRNGEPFEWQVNIRVKTPGESLRWTSTANGTTKTSGEIHLAKAAGDRGTVVALTMDYEIPGGRVGEWLAMLGGHDPDTLALINLHRLKALLETGEIPTVEGQPSGRSGDLLPTQH